MIQDMTCKQECNNLMRDIPIYDGKNMDLSDWLLQIGKVASLTIVKNMNWLQSSAVALCTNVNKIR